MDYQNSTKILFLVILTFYKYPIINIISIFINLASTRFNYHIRDD